MRPAKESRALTLAQWVTTMLLFASIILFLMASQARIHRVDSRVEGLEKKIEDIAERGFRARKEEHGEIMKRVEAIHARVVGG